MERGLWSERSGDAAAQHSNHDRLRGNVAPPGCEPSHCEAVALTLPELYWEHVNVFKASRHLICSAGTSLARLQGPLMESHFKSQRNELGRLQLSGVRGSSCNPKVVGFNPRSPHKLRVEVSMSKALNPQLLPGCITAAHSSLRMG